jgi:hypothetical protein
VAVVVVIQRSPELRPVRVFLPERFIVFATCSFGDVTSRSLPVQSPAIAIKIECTHLTTLSHILTLNNKRAQSFFENTKKRTIHHFKKLLFAF